MVLNTGPLDWESSFLATRPLLDKWNQVELTTRSESTTHFFLHCHHFSAICITLNNSLKGIDKDIPKLSDSSLTKVIPFGDSKYSHIQNHDILNSTITYIIDSKCFDWSFL